MPHESVTISAQKCIAIEFCVINFLIEDFIIIPSLLSEKSEKPNYSDEKSEIHHEAFSFISPRSFTMATVK